MFESVDLSDMVGKTFTKIEQRQKHYEDELVFLCDDGTEYIFYHSQDCCEHVYIESIVGDLQDLIGSPLLIASEETSGTNPPDVCPGYQEESYTWTFYKFATRKGYVDVRWYGESNGYYSEDVYLRKVSPQGSLENV